MDVFVVDTIARDVNDRCEILSLGKNRDGEQICVRVPFQPSFHVLVTQKNPTMTQRTMMKHRVLDAFDPYEKGGVRVQLVEKTQFVGYRGGETDWFVEATFETLKRFRQAKYAARDRKFLTFEANVDPLLKYFHRGDIDPCGWTRFENFVLVSTTDETRQSKPYVREYRVPGLGSVTRSECTDKPKLKIASFDLECFSSTGKFPDGSVPRDHVISIGTTYAEYGGEITRQTIHQLDKCNSIEGVDVNVYDDEAEEINAWLRELETECVDVLIGYNIMGFDNKFLDDRSSVLISMQTGDTRLELGRLGHLIDGGGERQEKQLASAAYGENTYVFFTTPGIVQMDLLAIYRKELKLDSYSLDSVSKTYLGHTKLDVSAKQMFEWFRTTDEDGLTRMAEYCVRDTELPIELNEKLCTLTNQIEMSKVVCVPINFLNLRGQQIRCYSLITRYANSRGFLVNDMDKDINRAGYVGATVLDPVKGAYVNDCVTCLDFASLYPSIMRAHEMCPSTIVLDDSHGDVEGVEYYRIETTPGKIVSFAQTGKSVVPALLADLALWRKRAKKSMGEAKSNGDAFGASLQNAKQLAFKVSMNSIYGFFGAGTGMIPLLDLASAVTSTGRDMIMRTKKACEDRGHRVIYGDTDSVFVIQNLGEEHRLDIAKHIEAGKALGAELTETLYKAPNELEYEKVYSPILLFAKKRYAAKMFEFDPTTPTKVDIKGLQIVRRDSPPFVRRVMQTVLDAIMDQRSFEVALDRARTCILDILDGRVPFDEFVVSKALRTNYANPDSMPHFRVAQKRKQRGRDPPTTGERVPFVIIRSLEHANDLIAARAEDPVYVKEHGLELDALYYSNNCLMKPVVTLLELEYGTKTQQLLTAGEISEKIMKLQVADVAEKRESKRLRFLKDTNQREITSFFKKK